MTPEDTVIVLDHMAAAYRIVVEPEAVPIWAEHLAGVDPGVAMDAADDIIGTEKFFPFVATFQAAVGRVLRTRAKEAELDRITGRAGPSADCPTCGGNIWYEVEPVPVTDQTSGEITGYNEAWKPCQQCGPLQFSRWLEHKEEAKAVSRYRRGSDEDLGFDPAKTAADLREYLAAHDPSKKPTKETP